ncbi:MAG: hypothetical protein WC974_09075 [Thermoplasmata archaeon]
MDKSLNNNSAEIIESVTPEPQSGEKVPLSELMSERKKRQDVEKQLASIQDTLKQDAEAKLKAQGELQELLKLKESELAEKNNLVNTLKAKADAYDLLEQEEREAAKKNLGVKWDDDYNQIPIKTLRKIVANFNIPSAVKIDNGSGAHITKITLTEKQKAERDLMFGNISDEEKRTESYIYAKNLK